MTENGIVDIGKLINHNSFCDSTSS